MSRHEIDTIGRNGVFKSCRPGLPRALTPKLRAIIGVPFDEAALGKLLAFYITERRQERRGGATSAQSNRALALVEQTARQLKRRPDRRARERLYATIEALDDTTAPLFRQSLSVIVRQKRHAKHWRIWTCSLEDIAAAAVAARTRHHGPKADALLLAALRGLVPIYEQATGKAFTHFQYKSAEKTNESQSVFGRFATLFLTRIDPKLTPSNVANGMDHLIAERKQNSGGQPKVQS